MSMEEYLAQLESELSRLPQNERGQAMDFYTDYLNDAEDIGLAMEKLGAPREVARSIMADRAVKEIGEKNGGAGVRKGISALWIVALATLSPVALALALALIALILALLVTVVALTLAMLAGGAWLFASSFAVMGIDIISGVFFAGVSLIFMGIAVVMGGVIWRVGGAVLGWAALKMNKRRSRRANA